MKKKKIIIAMACAVILVFLVGARHLRGQREQTSLNLSGTVEVTEVNVGPKIAGRIAALLADEGRTVKKGDRIGTLDNAEYASQVAQNKAQLRNAVATSDKAQKDRERAEQLFQNGAISSQQMDAARTAYDVALAQRQQAAAAVTYSEARLRDTLLDSPITGVVLRKNAEEGEVMSAGAALFTIADLENTWVKVYVKEDKLGLVKLGQRADVSTDSYRGKAYPGVVTYIASEAEFTPKNVQTQEERVKLVFGIKVTVKNSAGELKPGMPADVNIHIK